MLTKEDVWSAKEPFPLVGSNCENACACSVEERRVSVLTKEDVCDCRKGAHNRLLSPLLISPRWHRSICACVQACMCVGVFVRRQRTFPYQAWRLDCRVPECVC